MSKKLLFNFNREVIQNYTYVKYVGIIITATNTLEKPIKSATLKGSTKYRDIETEEILEVFEDGRNLELVSVKTPVLTTTNKIDGISKGLITMSGKITDVIDNANFTIKTTGARWTGAKSSSFYTQDMNSEFGTKYVIEFDGKLLKGDLDNAFGVKLAHWSDFIKGYNGNLPTNGKYRAVIKSGTNPANGRTTYFEICTTDSNAIKKDVEYQIRNLRVYPVNDNDEVYKSNILSTSEDVELRAVGDVRDELDLMTGELTQRTGKFMVDGTEDFGWYGDCEETLYGFNIYKSSIVEKLNNEVDADRPSLCSTLEYRGSTMYGKPGTGFAISGGSDSAFLQIVIQKEKLSDTTLDGIKQYLSENPLYFVVPLLDRSIKTVDLSILDQNENKVSSISSFNDTTHITASSEAIPPIFEGYLATKEVE